MPTGSNAAWTSTRAMLSGANLVFVPWFVGDDKVLDEYDRVLAHVVMADDLTTRLFAIGCHVPKGSVAKGKGYPLGDTCWIKSVSQKESRIEVCFYEDDPAVDVSYSVITVEKSPF